ncbi:MAG: nucleotidyltransferase family protein [Bacilli bacterium]|nr:nucleotidyltransferase family protein [Bacilli bacterium]
MLDNGINKIENIIRNRNSGINQNIVINKQQILEYDQQKENSYNFIKNYNFFMLKKICSDFNKLGIKYIVLKGCVLSYLLYDDPRRRTSSDIDIFVFKEYLETAIQYMENNGFVNLNKEIAHHKKVVHHYVFNNNICSVEIHKNILIPQINIDESYLKNTLQQYNIQGVEIYSFSITAILVHLFYHLYMDVYISHLTHYEVITRGGLPKSKRFMYRIYEIVLYVQKYRKTINWEEFYNEVNSQKLMVMFKFMFVEILELFPKIIPRFYAIKLCSKNYQDYDGNEKLNNVFHNFSPFTNKNQIGNYIDANWNQYWCNVIKNKDGYSFSNNDEHFSAKFDIIKSDGSLNIAIKVKDSDLSFSEPDNFDYMQSDGVHLMICSTPKYSYSGIFLFPKYIDGVYKILVYDFVSNKLISSELIEASIDINSYGYDVKVYFKNKFLMNNQISNCFYFGIIVSNCIKSCKHRISFLSHTNLESSWYDPVGFLKIEV